MLLTLLTEVQVTAEPSGIGKWIYIGAMALMFAMSVIFFMMAMASVGAKKVGKFEKISYKIFKEDYLKNINPSADEDEIQKIYDSIQMPKRTSSGAAGYDIYAPFDINLPFGKSMVIPTGLRCKIDPAWDLEIAPRSGSGFKFGIRLANTIGVIDSDYYSTERGGHIMVKIVNNDPAVNTEQKTFTVETKNGFAQGLFRQYGTTIDDVAKAKRIDGFGSSDKK